MRTVEESARYLESLLPQVMTVLFRSNEDDPLSHHTVGQIRLMRTLLTGSRTATDLSCRLGLSPSSLTQMASRMIKAGLVSKELDDKDRRVRKLSLTVAGRALMEKRQRARACVASEILSNLTEEKRNQFIELMQEIVGLDAEMILSIEEPRA